LFLEGELETIVLAQESNPSSPTHFERSDYSRAQDPITSFDQQMYRYDFALGDLLMENLPPQVHQLSNIEQQTSFSSSSSPTECSSSPGYSPPACFSPQNEVMKYEVPTPLEMFSLPDYSHLFSNRQESNPYFQSFPRSNLATSFSNDRELINSILMQTRFNNVPPDLGDLRN
jgi:hypothetical protein